MVDQARIDRFKSITEADPHNELGFLSLGRAYVDGQLYKDAIPVLMRALQLKPDFSQAYVALGEAQRGVGDPEGAVNTLMRGYKVAHDNGDLMPRNQIADMLKELGASIPEVKQVELTPEMASAGNIQCRRCGRIGPKMKERPFSGALGEQIHASVCGPCFQLWIREGTKVINELRLNLTDPAAQDIYDEHMKNFLALN
jgi:Fe-S cluster biosynthesis and repair protein YggX